MDESSPQTTSNTQRMWSFFKPTKIRNTTNYRANAFGFYSLNGESTIDFPDQSRKEDVCAFLESIRRANPDRQIIIVLDNFASHRSKMVLRRSIELGIALVFLPPYSPDLNPIEYLWKSIKRIVSSSMIYSEDHMKMLIKKTFLEISVFNSYAMGWIREFMPEEYNKYRKLGV